MCTAGEGGGEGGWMFFMVMRVECFVLCIVHHIFLQPPLPVLNICSFMSAPYNKYWTSPNNSFRGKNMKGYKIYELIQ